MVYWYTGALIQILTPKRYLRPKLKKKFQKFKAADG